MLIVDGNNVMGARPRTRWWMRRTAAAAELVEGLAASGVEATIVFDGPAPHGGGETQSGMTVRYSGAGRSADDAIVELVAALDDPAACTVVSSDRALRGRVSALGARVEGAGGFLGRRGLA